jgi:hypothetical protein
VVLKIPCLPKGGLVVTGVVTRVELLVRVKGMTMTRNGMLLLSFGAAFVLAGFYFGVADRLLACEFGLC